MRLLAALVEHPWLALLPALVFALLAHRTRRRTAWAAAAAWLLYAAYELGMKRRILCSGECNIRIDLLVIHPALVLLSLAAIVAVARRRRG